MNSKKKSRNLLALLAIMLIILTLVIIYWPLPGPDKNHFIGSGEINFNNNTTTNIFDNGNPNINDQMGMGYNTTNNCLNLSAYNNNAHVHFHHYFTPSNTPINNVRTYLLINNMLESSPAPITIQHQIAPAWPPISDFTTVNSGDLLDGNIFSITSTTNNTLTLDFHIPVSSVNEGDQIHLIFIWGDTFDNLKNNCSNCASTMSSDLAFLECLETTLCTPEDFSHQVQVYEVIKFCNTSPF